MNIKKPKGTTDIFGENIKKWVYIENLLREVSETFGFNEIRTPIFELESLFLRGVGEGTDIVQKEMFTFKDRGLREYALKPEGTAPTVRAFIEQKLYADSQPTKLFYITQAFRDERNQAGRFKQFHQFGVELFGSEDPSAEAEILSLISNFINKLKIQGVTLYLNSLGGEKCRKEYTKALKDFLNNNLEEFCEDCKNRVVKNTLRVLDCKNENCQKKLENAPVILDFLEQENKDHFEKLKQYLSKMNIDFKINPKIVRGLDYYTKTVFEFICSSKELGSQSTICGGGRYDDLVLKLGGPKTPAVGFALGIERLILLLEEQKINIIKKNTPKVYIGAIGEEGAIKAQQIAYDLRKDGIKCEYDIVKRSVKAQLKYADKINAEYVIIIGENELKQNRAFLKNMQLSKEIEINLSDLKQEILKEF